MAGDCRRGRHLRVPDGPPVPGCHEAFRRRCSRDLPVKLDDDLLPGLRYQHFFVPSEAEAPLDVARDPKDRPTTASGEFSPKPQRRGPDAEAEDDLDHPLALLFGDELLAARGAPATPLDEGIALDLGYDVVDGPAG